MSAAGDMHMCAPIERPTSAHSEVSQIAADD